jgi:hypothetical protein
MVSRDNYTLFLVSSYIKIVNVVRVSSILMYFQRRNRAKLLRKLQKEKERLLSLEKQQSQIAKEKRKNRILKQKTNKVGEKIREKYSLADSDMNHTHSRTIT